MTHHKPRAPLFLLLAICAAPLALAWLLTSPGVDWRPRRLAHHGELITPPIRLESSAFLDRNGRPADDHLWAGKWSLVLFTGGVCTDPCRDALRTMRHIQLALGKNVGRVQRAIAVPERASLVGLEAVLGEYPKPVVLRAPDGAAGVFPPRVSQGGTLAGGERAIYLVDPRGNLMMRFGASAELGDMVEDLERLLRASLAG